MGCHPNEAAGIAPPFGVVSFSGAADRSRLQINVGHTAAMMAGRDRCLVAEVGVAAVARQQQAGKVQQQQQEALPSLAVAAVEVAPVVEEPAAMLPLVVEKVMPQLAAVFEVKDCI